MIIGFYSYRFIQVLLKMKQKVILPKTNEEAAVLRKHPGETVTVPEFTKQKTGIIIYSLILFFVIGMLFLEMVTHTFGWAIYLLIFLPISHSYNLLNLVAVVKDGLLIGNQFIAWSKIKSFYFVRIDINHKYYGHSKEVNEAFQLKVKTKFISASCIITSSEMKDRLDKIVSDQVNASEPALEESK